MVHVHRGLDHGIDSVMFGAPFRLCLFPTWRVDRRGWTVLGLAVGSERVRPGTRYGCFEYTKASGVDGSRFSLDPSVETALAGCAFSCTLGNGRGLALSVPGETEAGACSRASNSREGAITRSSRWTESTRRRGSCVIRPVSCEIGEERLTASLPSTPSGCSSCT